MDLFELNKKNQKHKRKKRNKNPNFPIIGSASPSPSHPHSLSLSLLSFHTHIHRCMRSPKQTSPPNFTQNFLQNSLNKSIESHKDQHSKARWREPQKESRKAHTNLLPSLQPKPAANNKTAIIIIKAVRMIPMSMLASPILPALPSYHHVQPVCFHLPLYLL